MREMDWPAMGAAEGDLIDTADLRVTRRRMGGAVLISGDLDAGLAALAPGAPLLGLAGDWGVTPCAVRIARDRALLVGEAPLKVTPGWHAAGFATTPADDQWAVFTVMGGRAPRVIAEGMAVDPAGGSPSAAVLFAGETCLLLRQGGGFAVCVETPRAWFLDAWLRAVSADPA